MTERNLRLAVQKSGRLSDKSRELLTRAGMIFESRGDQLISRAKGHPLELMLVRDDDIPSFISNQVCQLGIVGRNVLEEKGDDGIVVIRSLGFGYCRLSLAIGSNMIPFDNVHQLNGKRIATSYPRILQRFLDDKGIQARIVQMSGSVEVAPSIGIADAICDLVSTGATLESNGLKEVSVLLESEAVLIRPKGRIDEPQEKFIERLLARFDGLQKASQAKYIMMNAPKASVYRISELIPGMERPTVIPLSGDSDRVAIHAVAKEEIFWETMEKLKDADASGILVLPIEKIIE